MSSAANSDLDDGSREPKPPNGSLRRNRLSAEQEITVIDILLVLVKSRKLIGRTVIAFVLLGVTYALLAPKEYTATTQVVRESQTEAPSQLSGGISALRGLGINIGGASSGLSASAIPDIVGSREVRLAVVQDTFSFPDTERPMTFVEYANRPLGWFGFALKYTLKLPWTIKDALFDDDIAADRNVPTEESVLTDDQYHALKSVSEMVSASVDSETGLMTISVVARGRQLAAGMAQSFVDHLSARVREIRTQKVRERLGFVKSRFQEAQDELEAAENRLARFLERNQNPTTATLRFQRDRLQRQVRFKEQLYTELQSQVTQTELDLQRRQPVVTVVEKPVPPKDRSAPQRTLIVLFCIVGGTFFGIAVAFVRWSLRATEDDEQQSKLKELQNALPSHRWLDPVRRRMARSTEQEDTTP
jgi:uncharacterized protein involved in exopolysaccharide biosynthesis